MIYYGVLCNWGIPIQDHMERETEHQRHQPIYLHLWRQHTIDEKSKRCYKKNFGSRRNKSSIRKQEPVEKQKQYCDI